jgi:ABC-type xylose transport system permease subunit
VVLGQLTALILSLIAVGCGFGFLVWTMVARSRQSTKRAPPPPLAIIAGLGVTVAIAVRFTIEFLNHSEPVPLIIAVMTWGCVLWFATVVILRSVSGRDGG